MKVRAVEATSVTVGLKCNNWLQVSYSGSSSNKKESIVIEGITFQVLIIIIIIIIIIIKLLI